MHPQTPSKIAQLFDKYSDRITDPILKDILARQSVFSLVNTNANALILGINPSYRKVEKSLEEGYPFNFQDLYKDRYFGKFHKLIEPYKHLTFTYLDIFTQRHTDQEEIYKFFKDKVGMEYLCEHLMISQEIIENLKPKLILVFNKKVGDFLGNNIKSKDDDFTNVWLGYNFKRVEGINNAFEIIGFKDLKERLNPSLKHTALIGTTVYFSKFMNQFIKITEKEAIRHDLQALSNRLL